MGRTSRLAAATAASFSLLACELPAAKPVEIHNDYAPVSVKQRQTLKDVFHRLIQHWEDDRGVPLSTTLEIAQGARPTVCGNVTIDGEKVESLIQPYEYMAGYCHNTNKVVLSERFVSEVNSFAEKQTYSASGKVLEYVMAHEVAHAAQDALGLDLSQELSAEGDIGVEQQADCYAGSAMQSEFPESISEAREGFKLFASYDETHGYSIDRLQKFDAGVTGSSC